MKNVLLLFFVMVIVGCEQQSSNNSPDHPTNRENEVVEDYDIPQRQPVIFSQVNSLSVLKQDTMPPGTMCIMDYEAWNRNYTTPDSFSCDIDGETYILFSSQFELKNAIVDMINRMNEIDIWFEDKSMRSGYLRLSPDQILLVKIGNYGAESCKSNYDCMNNRVKNHFKIVHGANYPLEG